MEPSSPFLYKSIIIDKMEVIKTDIEGVLIIEPRLLEMLVAISSRVSASVSLKRRLSHWLATRWSSARTTRA